MADEKKVTDAEVAEKKAKKADNKKAKKAPSKFSPKNIGKGIVRFFKDLRGETKKIVWPDAKMVVKSTGVVLATVLVLGAGVWILDFATSGAITAVMNAANETEVTEVVTESSEDEHDHDHDHEDEEETTEDVTAE
ncbi:MAG: preprotein translocase subunit SecE [Ruminococcaceae bacterium]|nr:preprotein translocase subunit SecE [Oscillospiraceae bacterium]